MVMKIEPIYDAIKDVLKGRKKPIPRIILLSPQGRALTQDFAEELSKNRHLILICGHYEGVDERVREYLITDEVSIGDYVLTGGELAAMVLIDTVVRLLPGALGDKDSTKSESFSNGLLEYPQYTRPADFMGKRVPDVLSSGNHKIIEKWRREEAIKKTLLNRPDIVRKDSPS
jgi:tRNA (guanine37-N1)-methyltransferase